MGKPSLAVLDTLSSGRFLAMLGFLWMISIWSSIFYMSPGTDDAHFILQALGFISHGDIGFLYIETFYEFFLTLPPYAFFHAVFYLAWDAIGLPINYYTYKIFHLLALNALIVVSAAFVYFYPAASKKIQVARASLMLVLLAITPFTLDIFNPRPETMGLAVTVLALFFFACANGSIGKASWGYPAAGFFLGLAAATHPSFTITSGGVAVFALILVVRNAAGIGAIAAIACGLLPVLAVVIWYAAHLPLSLDTLMANVGGRSPTSSSFGVTVLTVVEYILLRLPSNTSISARLYWGLPFWIFGLLLLACLVFLIRDFLKRVMGPVAQMQNLLWVFLAMTLLNALIAPSGRIQIYVVSSFAAALVVASRYRGEGDTAKTGEAIA